MDNSWVKLHRKFLESPLWKYAIHARFEVLVAFWIYLLTSVNWEEKKWYDGKQENVIPPGSLITSLQNLADALEVSTRTVRTCLMHLENMQMITRRTTNKWTQVWIVNWAKYQGGVDANDTQADKRTTNERQTNDKRTTTTKEYKNIRTKEYNTGDKRPELKDDRPTAKEGMQRVSDVMQRVGFSVTSSGISQPWQDKAFRYAKGLKIILSEDMKPRWLKIFKQASLGRKPGNLERAYTYLVDHPGDLNDEQKISCFFFIYENGLKLKT